MVATPGRIGLITNQYRLAAVQDDAVQARYGKDARDSGTDPVETFFDSVDDAQAIALERMKLLKRDRRRFRQIVPSILDLTGDLDFSQVTPSATVIDDTRGANLVGAIVEAGLDYGTDRTTLVTWGTAVGADILTILGDTLTINGETVEMI